MATMYDSVNAKAIPTSAEVVAGYVDGDYAWSEADWALFPHALKVAIAVFATTDSGLVLDVEKGNSTPAEAVGWVERRRAELPSSPVTVYCSLSNWDACRTAFADAHAPEPCWWIADWDGTPDLVPGAVAHQYQSTPLYDLSVTDGTWPATAAVEPVDRAPAPLPPVPTVERYVVVRGDTLDTLAAEFHTTAADLYHANAGDIENAARARGFSDSHAGAILFPGEVLRLP